MAAIVEVYHVISEIGYLKKHPAKFHPYPIGNYGGRPNNNKKNNKNEMSSNMRSVPDPKIC